MSTPWARGDHTICLMPSFSHSGTTSASMTRHSSEYCGWFETMPVEAHVVGQPQGVGDLLGGPLGHPDVVDLALADEVVEGPHGLFERGLVVVAVGLEQIDVVGLQPLQRRVERLDDVLAREAPVVGVGPVGQYTLVKISIESRRTPCSARPSTDSAPPMA